MMILKQTTHGIFDQVLNPSGQLNGSVRYTDSEMKIKKNYLISSIGKCVGIVCVVMAILTSKPGFAMDQTFDALAQREHNADGYSYSWGLTQVYTSHGVENHKILQALDQQYRASLTEEAHRNGITDAKSVEQYIDLHIIPLRHMISSYQIDLSCEYNITSDGSYVLVKGQNQNSQSFKGMYRQLYGPNFAVRINDDAVDPETKTNVGHAQTTLWATTNSAWRYRNPFDAMYMYPETFMALIARNPLTAYDANWKMASSDASSIVYSSDITDGDDAPFNVRVTLARQYGFAPRNISIHSANFSEEYQISGFRLYNNVWIGSIVQSVQKYGIQNISRSWRLKSVSSSGKIPLNIPTTTSVSDYRLLGPGLTQTVMFQVNKSDDPDVITYIWPDKLRTLQQLRNYRAWLNKRSGTDEPKARRSQLMTIVCGGLLLGLGLTFMIRRKMRDD